MQIYSTDDFHYVWKPAGTASTPGEGASIFDSLQDDFLETQQSAGFDAPEYGLLNRLDVDTAGIVYFARTPAAREWYLEQQERHSLVKTYVATIQGRYHTHYMGLFRYVSTPIGHHAHLSDRMVADQKHKEVPHRGRWQEALSYVEFLEYDAETNTSTVLVKIAKGVRHQIRVHLASLGCPILGDKIYNKKATDEGLQLYSVGIEYDEALFKPVLYTLQ